MINSSSYTIDFSSMKKINNSTGFKRQVVKVSALVAHTSPRWYKIFRPYSPEDSAAIEVMYQSHTPDILCINGRTYTFKFDEMCQVNTKTLCKRKLRRSFSNSVSLSDVVKPSISQADMYKEVSGEIAPSSASLTQSHPRNEETFHKGCKVILRGPKESLLSAEKDLMDKLNSFITQDTIKSLPDSMTEELRENMSLISLRNNFHCSFSMESELQVLKLEGVHSRVHKTASDIHEQLHIHLQSMLAEKEKETLLTKECHILWNGKNSQTMAKCLLHLILQMTQKNGFR